MPTELPEQLSNPESQISRSSRESRKPKNQSTAADPDTAQAFPPSSFARVPRVDALGPLPEAEEYEEDCFVTLYDASKGLVDAYKEGDAPKFYGEGSAFAFSQDGPPSDDSSNRRPEFWTIPTVRLPRFVFG